MAKKKSARTSSVSGKKGTGKFKRSGSASARSAKSGRSTGRNKSVRTAKPTGHALVDVVCTECFTELALDTGVRGDSLECPICGHASKRTNDTQLSQDMALLKAERTNAAIALFLTVVTVLGFAVWAVFQANPINSDDGGMFWGPLSLSIISGFLLMIFAGAKYEGNRYEYYF
ncbi:MAG: hypothetical protein JKY65_07420 [Planctomycetes bacterium]|nr:hypothetical protein [Planctomycetota bacterium]